MSDAEAERKAKAARAKALVSGAAGRLERSGPIANRFTQRLTFAARQEAQREREEEDGHASDVRCSFAAFFDSYQRGRSEARSRG